MIMMRKRHDIISEKRLFLGGLYGIYSNLFNRLWIG